MREEGREGGIEAGRKAGREAGRRERGIVREGGGRMKGGREKGMKGEVDIFCDVADILSIKVHDFGSTSSNAATRYISSAGTFRLRVPRTSEQLGRRIKLHLDVLPEPTRVVVHDGLSVPERLEKWVHLKAGGQRNGGDAN